MIRIGEEYQSLAEKTDTIIEPLERTPIMLSKLLRGCFTLFAIIIVVNFVGALVLGLLFG